MVSLDPFAIVTSPGIHRIVGERPAPAICLGNDREQLTSERQHNDCRCNALFRVLAMALRPSAPGSGGKPYHRLSTSATAQSLPAHSAARYSCNLDLAQVLCAKMLIESHSSGLFGVAPAEETAVTGWKPTTRRRPPLKLVCSNPGAFARDSVAGVTYEGLCQEGKGVLRGVDETRKMEHPQCRRLRPSRVYQQRFG